MVILLVHCLLATSVAKKCKDISGSLRQIDAGDGLVYGVSDNDMIYTRRGRFWSRIPGRLKHVTVGPSGVWGVNKADQIYKRVDDKWICANGRLKQVDAGGQRFIAGANRGGNIYCKGWKPIWTQIPGSLKYYSCGPYGCWGVNKDGDIFFRTGVTAKECSGTGAWQSIVGKLNMVEVGTDGSVFRVTTSGQVFHRTGITAKQPAGKGWARVSETPKSRHVSYDKGHLWAITRENRILRCKVPKNEAK